MLRRQLADATEQRLGEGCRSGSETSPSSTAMCASSNCCVLVDRSSRRSSASGSWAARIWASASQSSSSCRSRALTPAERRRARGLELLPGDADRRRLGRLGEQARRPRTTPRAGTRAPAAHPAPAAAEAPSTYSVRHCASTRCAGSSRRVQRVAEREQEAPDVVVVELSEQLGEPVAQRIPVASPIRSGSDRSPAGAALRGKGEHHAVDPAGRRNRRRGRRIIAQLADHEIAPARMNPSDAKRGDAQEVVGEAVDQLARRSAETAGVVAADRGGQLALVDQAGRRVEQRDQQLSMLVLEGPERGPHRLGRPGQLILHDRRAPICPVADGRRPACRAVR